MYIIVMVFSVHLPHESIWTLRVSNTHKSSNLQWIQSINKSS